MCSTTLKGRWCKEYSLLRVSLTKLGASFLEKRVSLARINRHINIIGPGHQGSLPHSENAEQSAHLAH